MRKTILLFCLFGLLSTNTRAADTYDYVVFTLTNGTKQAVSSSNLTITFSDGNLVASNPTKTLATIPLASLSSMEFSTEDSTGIEETMIDFLTTDDSVTIYDMNGRQMPDKANLPKGVYILKTNNKTIKIQLK